MKIEFDLYDLSEDVIDDIYKHVYESLDIKMWGGDILLCSETSMIEKRIQFKDLVKLEADFYKENDPELLKPNLECTKEKLLEAVALIDELLEKETLPDYIGESDG